MWSSSRSATLLRTLQHRLRPLPKCKEGKTGICLNVNPARPGAAYGYVDMGGWVGGQAEYVMVPYADWNLLKFPDKDQSALRKSSRHHLPLGHLPDGLSRRGDRGCRSWFHGLRGRRRTGGLACAASCHLLGAAVVIVGDMIPERLAQAQGFGCETVDCRKTLRSASRSRRSWANRWWIARVDAWALKRAATARTRVVKRPATVLNSLMTVTRAGGASASPDFM